MGGLGVLGLTVRGSRLVRGSGPVCWGRGISGGRLVGRGRGVGGGGSGSRLVGGGRSVGRGGLVIDGTGSIGGGRPVSSGSGPGGVVTGVADGGATNGEGLAALLVSSGQSQEGEGSNKSLKL